MSAIDPTSGSPPPPSGAHAAPAPHEPGALRFALRRAAGAAVRSLRDLRERLRARRSHADVGTTSRLGPPTEARREREARAAVESLLAAALAVSTACLVLLDAPAGASDAGANRDEHAPLSSISVDLAHDPAWALRLLPGVGPTRANAILRDRDRLGPLPSLDALVRVPGFGRKTVEGLAEAGACVAPSPRGPPSEEPATERPPARPP
jgi:competence protein ComEA